jgi:AAA+ ATPase superfamily predicted ATPase
LDGPGNSDDRFFREPRNYFAILKAIAFGKSKIGEIVNDTGLDKGILHRYLFTLDDLSVRPSGALVQSGLMFIGT